MKLVRRRLSPFHWALLLVPPILSVPFSTDLYAAKTPPVPDNAITKEEQSPGTLWVDDLARALTQHFAKKYPRYTFEPFKQELDRIREALARGDRAGARRELGVFLKMAAGLAHDLGQDAATELTGLAEQLMPDEEFAIVYPGVLRAP